MYSAACENDKLSLSTSSDPCHRFSLAEIILATKNFDDRLVIGEGGFGKVFKGHFLDVKSSNILLDKNWEAMISDFGLTRLTKIGPINQLTSYVDASVKGTFGYLDPEYFYSRKLTRKTDVFAFGILLFVLLSGRLAVDERYGEEQCSLVRWAQKCVKERKFDLKCLRELAQIGYRCLLSVPKERPTLTDVVASLQRSLELHVKCDASARSPGIMGFTWQIHKYLVSTAKNVPGGLLKLGTYMKLKRFRGAFTSGVGLDGV